ncbi:MAG TPA: glycosyltransferase family 2 protein [Candidatus Baltobacteraceae bacterium]|nr:glycosyltransferase family 2 protein [Candidatus Baltobacteraceae bacterium]
MLFLLETAWITIALIVSPSNALLSAPFLYLSGLPVIVGIALAFVELAFQLPAKRRHNRVRVAKMQNTGLTVALTAFNDEQSIGLAVADFIGHPLVRHVLVIDNGSSDGTREVAGRAGATVVREDAVGYGSCVYRAFREALQETDTELILLCEGDRTFRAFDIDKFLAYIPHAEIVNGTRIVEQLRERDTQLSTFMYYGNFAVGKLLELKHIGRGTFTDVGTTYKLCRREALERLLPHLDRRINLEFNAHFLDEALRIGIEIVECPITFFARVGKSKGGNASNVRALRTGLRMIVGLVFGWSVVADRGAK